MAQTTPRPSPGQTKPPHSLKTLLKLNKYEFVRDVQPLVDDNVDCILPARASDGSTQPGSQMREMLLRSCSRGSEGSGGLGDAMFPRQNLSSPGVPLTPTQKAALLNSMDAVQFELSQSPESQQSNLLVACPDLPAPMKRIIWSIDDYQLVKHVHHGYASDVYEAICKHSRVRVALKVYAIDDLEDLTRVQLLREVAIHSRCQHLNIIQLYAAFFEDVPEQYWQKDTGAAARPTWRALALVQEWAGQGDVLRYVHKHGGKLAPGTAMNVVMVPLMNALQYLHDKGVIHRDIKPENLVFNDERVLKIIDFGLAVDMNDERANTRAGTLDYMAPEVLCCPTKFSPEDYKHQEDAQCYTTGADVWAVGVVLYHLLTGRPPFRDQNAHNTAQRIMTCQLTFPPDWLPGAEDFVTECLQPDPADRPTVLYLQKHPFVKSSKERASFRAAAKRCNSFVEFITRRDVRAAGSLLEAALEAAQQLRSARESPRNSPRPDSPVTPARAHEAAGQLYL